MATILMVRGGVRDVGRYNYHLHERFFERAFTWAGHRLVHYGRVAGETKDGPISFDPKLDVRTVAREVKADLVVSIELNQPVMNAELGSLPRLVYVCDLHRVKSLQMLGGADLMIVRAKAFEALVPKLPGGRLVRHVHWLPFSFNQQTMDSIPERQPRYPLVTFGGSIRQEPWPVRREALLALHDAALVSPDVRVMRHDPLPLYYQSLKSSMLGLACSTRWKLNPAKHIEIPAAGGVLLTDGSPGMAELLPRDLYEVYTPSTIVGLVRGLVSSKEKQSELRARGIRAAAHARAHHSDERRAEQLLGLLDRYGMPKLQNPTGTPAARSCDCSP